ncbi:hypothetical protein [Clostridium paraputrificum]|uniref:Uncharacterized protein n=1 Tax=Clostridium paraputrificum TaxID=29363 RepID=A0A6N3GSV4_9CLOT|nr:hypothetical protein [Clostridium sp.]MBS5986796.1 hypothetical protein [Clostridium sp.]
MLDALMRDTKIKPKKLRREGYTTGTLRRKNGEIIPVTLTGRVVDSYLAIHGDHSCMYIRLGDEEINTEIINVYRDVLIHNTIDIDLKEK